MGQRSFIVQPPHALQHPASNFDAPAIVGTSPMADRSVLSLPMPFRRHDCAPICNTNALTNTGTSIAAGEIGTIDPIEYLQPSGETVRLDAKVFHIDHGYLTRECAAVSHKREFRRGCAILEFNHDCLPLTDWRSPLFSGARELRAA